MIKNWIVLVVLSLTMISCASLTKQGQEALEEGKYEKALSLFERAYQNDSNDPDAKEGLRKAQQMWLERKLIDVRLLRLGSNFGDSESLLLNIIQNENKWQVFPTGAAFATQTEEMKLFAERVGKRIDEYLQKANPLAAQYEFNRNNFILEKALAQNTATIKNDIYVRGKQFCQTMQKSLKADEYYTGQWLQKTCLVWKVPVKLPKLKNSVALFRDVKVKTTVEGMNPELDGILNENVKKAFMQSKWHDAEGKVTLDLNVEGKFTSEQFETDVQRAKTYYVQIPYKEISKRIKEPKNDSSVLSLVGLLLGSSSNEEVHDNGDGTETVITTKYRSEERIHRYTAVEMKALKTLRGKLQAGLDKQGFLMDLNERYSFLEDRHSENFPDVGLKPTKPVFVTDAQWLQTMSQGLVSDLTRKLQSSWVDRFCAPEPNRESLSEREDAYRCGYQVNVMAPEKLRQFYLKTWQIKYEDWLDLIGGA
ncbi:hypothetical protein [Bdellovibrio bacteriovorus]|uniref:tetratricopeptide repeat protein n=1 Tax=Bdellovibrio bacteriovorus TaxID=959 RepID=UPI0035A984E1